MKLLSYTLNSYNPFKFSRIKELSLSYPENIQIILGTNGSGKSSYLRTLTPYPLPRSVFDKNGYRKMVYEHRGEIFTLISDYSNKTSPHQFIKDDDGNLNDGGTTGVQIELIEKYFSLSKEKEFLLFGDVNFCDMSPSQVKPFLMKICPLDLSWILDKQKKTSTLLRNVRYSLKELSKRETQLLSEISSDEELSRIRHDKKIYHKIITNSIAKQSSIQTRIDIEKKNIDNLRILQNKITNKNLSDLEKELHAVDEELSILRLNNEKKLTTIEKEKELFKEENLSNIELRKKHIEESLEKTIEKLDSIEKELNKSNSDNQEELTNKLLSLKYTEKETRPYIIKDYLNTNEIEALKSNLPRLNDILSSIGDSKRIIWNRKKYNRKVNLYNKELFKFTNAAKELQVLSERIEYLEKSLNNGFDPNMELCSRNKCVLFRMAVEKRSERENELSGMKNDYNKLKKYVDKYSSYINKRGDDIKIREIDNVLLEKLFSLLSVCPQLKRYIDSNILITLSKTPYKLYRDILKHIEDSDTTETYNTVVRQIEAYEERLKDIQSVSKSYKEYLESDKRILSNEITELETELKECYKHLEIKNFILKEKELTNIKDVLRNQYKSLKDLEDKIFSIENTLSDYKTSLQEVNTVLEQTMEKLTNVEMILSSQEKILSRYEEEVKVRKQDLEQKYLDLEDLEYAQIEIPKRYMENWLHALTKQVNKYIEVVWNQQLELLPPTDEKEYRFRALFKGDVIENLSLCSSAQRDIINLCVCLALRSPMASSDGIGMKDYPLALDETGATFDETHKHRLIDLFSLLTTEGIVSQIYLTSHHAVIHGALANSQTLVLNSDNIMLPSQYNQRVELTYM